LALRLGALGERESGTARLEEAVVALRAALEEFTRERAPLEWGETFGRQGLALMNLAERTRDAVMAQTALQQIEAAVEVLRADGDVRAAIFEPRLSDARRIRDALTHAGRNYRPKLP
jgi:GAF domain-containing protein